MTLINPIKKIEIDVDANGDVEDITFFVKGSNEPFNSAEFLGPTRENMKLLEDLFKAALKFYASAQYRTDGLGMGGT